jgi:hypothetical protein
MIQKISKIGNCASKSLDSIFAKWKFSYLTFIFIFFTEQSAGAEKSQEETTKDDTGSLCDFPHFLSQVS